jgi:lipoyl(octanoyl) transferase
MTYSSDIFQYDSPVPYAEGLRLQRSFHEERRQGLRPDALLLLEHPPVITLGRNADSRDVTTPSDELVRLGIEVHRVERGGRATYHGPGQIVGYPVWRLAERKLGIRRLVEGLETAMMQTAEEFSVKAFLRPGLPGVFCEEGKIGAVGLAVQGGVTLHGFAFNVDADLNHFRLIVPCGLSDIPAASLSSVLNRRIETETVRNSLIRNLGKIFETSFRQ